MMPQLPSDPAMLLSVVNMHLRDSFNGSIDDMCSQWGIKVESLLELMQKSGWEYNPRGKRFW